MKPLEKMAVPVQASPLHCAARRLKRSLKPGRTPVCWKKQVERRTSRTAALHKFCTWASEQTRRQPRLSQQPLFGNCLAELAGLETRRGETETGETPPVAVPPRWPWEVPVQPGAEARRPSAEARQDAPPGTPAVPPRRPGAGEVESVRVQTRQARPLPSPAHRPLRQADLARLGRVRPQVYSSGTARHRVQTGGRRRQPAPPGSLQPWFEIQRARAIRSLQTLGSPAAQGATGTAGQPPVSQPQQDWQIELNGPSASLDLLARLAGVPAGDVLDIAMAGSPGARPGGVPRRPASRSAAPGQDRRDDPPPGFDLGSRLPGGRIVRQTLRTRVQPAPGGTDLEAGGVALPTVTGSEFTPLAPPADTVSLPALSPPQKPYDPTLPVAAATLQYGARRELVDTAPDDLDALAARIKRILDEEARRHGIDV